MVGVLGLQGDVEEHVTATYNAFSDLGIAGDVVDVRSLNGIESLDGLILPGGESTTIGRLTEHNAIRAAIGVRVREGMPIFGACAGLVMLSKEIRNSRPEIAGQPRIGTLDIEVERNAFGRQKESCEVNLKIPVIGETPFRGVFIRAPAVIRVGKNVAVLASFNDSIVAVCEANMMGTSFHPELTSDTRFHRLFLHRVREYVEGRKT